MRKVKEIEKEFFQEGKSLDFTLDLSLGNFMIYHNENQLLAKVEGNLIGKRVIPFFKIEDENTQITITEQSFEPSE